MKHFTEQQIETQEQAPPIPLTRRFSYGFTCGVIGGLIGLVTSIANGEAAYGGIMGLLIGAALGGYLGPELMDWFTDHVELPDSIRRRLRPSAYREGNERESVDEETIQLQSPALVQDLSKTTVLAEPLLEEDDIYSERVAEQPLPFARLAVVDILEHSGRNDYQVVVGRSVIKEKGKARRIKFKRRHMKCIGASQFGKSSMAAYLLSTIGETHTPDHVQFAILDMEDRTGRLFDNDPHIASVKKQGQHIRLHARTIPEVVEHLGYVFSLVEWRYKQPLEIQEKMPLLIVYFEEFLALKNALKNAMYRGTDDERKQAKYLFYTFMNRFTHIAQRGLKVGVQFLVCAQVEYRDEDLVEAFANIVNGFAFCVKPTAAQAAGFFQADMLTQNAQAKIKGQCVVEMPEFNDILLAPDFDLEDILLHCQPQQHTTSFVVPIEEEESQESQEPKPVYEPRYFKPVEETLEEKVRRAWDLGHTTLDACAISTGEKVNTIRLIWQRVRMEKMQQDQQESVNA